MNLYNFGLEYLAKNAPQYKITDPEIGIVTATDSNTFIGVQTLYMSIKDKVNFICYDIGMSAENLAWCKYNNLKTIKLTTTIPLINKWQTYLKPFVIQESPFNYTIWIDSDCVVTGDLSKSPLIQNKQTFFTKHWINIKYLKKNSKELYNLYPVAEDSDIINAGVFAINKLTDLNILDEWLFMIKKAVVDPVLRGWLVHWDEGCLQWAIRKTNNSKKIVDEDSAYNFYCEQNGASLATQQQCANFYNGSFGDLKAGASVTAFFKLLLKQQAYVCHFATCMQNKTKYWKRWV